ncbi:NUDIX hydrolase [Candidatus Saccharibacteria bacterium]|nr:NUDIX hydrolase [Candidatus Saccharibacteria bacterium]
MKHNPLTVDNIRLNPIWRGLGVFIYFLCWPAIWCMIRMSPTRARVLVVVEGELLLAQDWLGPNRWSIPGGGLHRGEDPKIGALRELEEETGIQLDLKQLKLLGKMNVHNNYIKTKLIIYTASLPVKPQLRISGIEILDHTWVGRSQLKHIKIDNNTAKIIDSFAKQINLLQ